MNQRLSTFLLPKQQSGLYYGALIGAGLGLFILLLSVQTYLNFNQLLRGGTDGSEVAYVQINKPVNFLSTLGSKATFTDAELSELQEVAGVQSVGAFSSNQFKVGAKIPALKFSTELFFEAVPDEFLDIQPSAFFWESGKDEVPIILSRDYLALYNFGFAPSQGLPQFTQGTIKRVSFELRIRGNGRRASYKGRIVGFSDRINSILVPADFMAYANEIYGEQAVKKPSRVILAVDNVQDQELLDFLSKKGYELSTGRIMGEGLQSLVRALLAAVLLIGGLILLLAIFVFILNFQLLITRFQTTLQRLHHLGYAKQALAGVWQPMVIRMAVILPIVATVLLIASQWVISTWLAGQGFRVSSYPSLSSLVLAGVAGLVLFVANMRGIRNKIDQLT
ncbi:MAG: hypothetical protein AAGH79_08115 [Bacteroidota bacterium]